MNSIKWMTFGVASLFLLTSTAVAKEQTKSANEAPLPVCQALVSEGNDLYLVSGSGAVLTRFTSDGVPKLSPSMAPDASKVAFIPSTSTQSFTVVDTDGENVNTTVPTSPTLSTSIFTGVMWNTDTALAAQNHVGLSASSFNFYNVPSRLWDPLHASHMTSEGQACAIKNQTVACIDGDNIVIDGTTVYSENIFAPSSATQLGSLSIALGASVSTQTTPTFTIELLSVTDGVTLQITLPTGLPIQQTVANGSPIVVTLGDLVYGFVPTIDSATGLVQINIVQSAFGPTIFDSAITWYDDDHVAVIERTPTWAHLLLIKAHGEAKEGQSIGRNPSKSCADTISGAINLPVGVQSMHFSREDKGGKLLVFKTLNGFGYAPINVVWPETPGTAATIQVGQITSLPNSLAATLPSGAITVQVLDWGCKLKENNGRW